MDRTQSTWSIREGATVYAADGDKVGKVREIQGNYMVVEKGFFFPTDYFVPASAIASMDGDDVYLTVSKDDALNSNWSEMPSDYTWTSEAVDTQTTTGMTADRGAYADETFRDRTTDVRDDRTVQVEAHEEELTAVKRPVDRGSVKVQKEVLVEDRVLDVPVTEERVKVTRRVVDRDVSPGEVGFTDDTIEVPIQGEEVNLQKRVRVAEVVDIEKEAVERTEQVAGQVRREEIHVQDSSDADVIAGQTGAASTRRGTSTTDELIDPAAGMERDARESDASNY